MVGDGAATLVRRRSAAGPARPADALDRFLAIYDCGCLKHTRPYAQVLHVLDTLGAHALAVLTNKPLRATRSILLGTRSRPVFRRGRDCAGDGVFARKPEPAGLLHLVSRAGVSPAATLLVGDSIVDWQTARNASTAVCLARYGFGFDGFPLDQLAPLDRVIDAPIELLTL